jgi:hypothetical protein
VTLGIIFLLIYIPFGTLETQKIRIEATFEPINGGYLLYGISKNGPNQKLVGSDDNPRAMRVGEFRVSYLSARNYTLPILASDIRNLDIKLYLNGVQRVARVSSSKIRTSIFHVDKTYFSGDGNTSIRQEYCLEDCRDITRRFGWSVFF